MEERNDQNPVILHQFPRNPRLPVPNISPPCLKLETWMRMAKIPYDVNTAFKKSSKGKFPWIEHKGKHVADSQFCIEYLTREFGVDLDEGLSEADKAVATAFRVMLEENTFWTFLHFRFFSPNAPTFRDNMLHSFPALMRHLGFWKFKRTVGGNMNGHGIGRHTEDEIYNLGERDLAALSGFLGSKKFLLGDKPCVTDAAIFGLVANILWTAQGSPQEKAIRDKMPNLLAHAQRMKEEFYPDWDQLVSGKDPNKDAQNGNTNESYKQRPH
ncbi:predicted protein [Nematostella vectensis]|uniref:Failed axon connections homolog n=1 Tax=Nematostella vectensis TaxID=45351 RepID=A7SNC8_NEMVE|nr:failed axon connections homolog [Nematostella vectensis]EDO34760.1 predicted protein [Nematostella vectensis]|eukprot:XP_001626860.1 predicted protein [Nematostella vectensis]